MAITNGNVITNLLENITVTEKLNNGVLVAYDIRANEGYVLHDNMLDYEDADGNIVLGYKGDSRSVPKSYDFTANPREFYAVLESEVPDPENQIFGGGNNNDHEVMSEDNETETE